MERVKYHPVRLQRIQSQLDGCAELEKQCFHEPWSAKSLELLTNDGIGVGYLLPEKSDDGLSETVTAYGGMLVCVDEGQITNIAVSPAYRRQGRGEAIVRALIRHAKNEHLSSVTLEVRASNLAAQALYRKLGFAEVGKRRGFYAKPTEDAIIMTLRL